MSFPEHLKAIGSWLEAKVKWIGGQTPEKNKDLRLTGFLLKELEKSVDIEDRLFAQALAARSTDEKHTSILGIIENRRKTEENWVEENKEPRRKGWIEMQLDAVCARYEADPGQHDRDRILNLLSTLKVNRRVRYFYDIQKLRIAVGNRCASGYLLHGDSDHFIEYQKDQLERMERHCEKIVDETLTNSPDGKFYSWLIDNHVGIGTMMAACIISEVGAPERFRTISALWKYAGLAVVGHDENGQFGHAQMRAKGEMASWNHFLRTKLLGVAASCIVKAQTKYLETPEEKTKGRNIKVLHDYKFRLQTRNDMVPASERYYDAKGREIMSYWKTSPVQAHKGSPNGPLVDVLPCRLQRRTPAHINKMANRYMMKMFIVDLVTEWRSQKGLPAFETYDVAKLRGGRRHGE